MTGVSHLAKRSIATLSGGEKQRVIVARALCQEPQILLLDEPTANLDLGYQHGLLELIAGLNKEQGITVIAAIHDLNLAAPAFSIGCSCWPMARSWLPEQPKRSSLQGRSKQPMGWTPLFTAIPPERVSAGQCAG